jgi:hypothetical protein
MHPSEFPTLRRAKSSEAPKTRLTVEALEMRVVPYATTGNAWPHPNLVTISFVPDGTNLGGVSSNLFATLNAKWSTTTWENQILRAAQVWAQRSNLNFTVVADSGAATGSGSYEQGDPTMGDIRIGGYNFGSSTLATGYLPPPPNNYSIAGDIEFNTGQVWAISGTYDLFTVAAHEFGHALGMTHSTDATAIMYGTYNTRKTDLGSDDIAGIQSIYGARTPDQYDTGAGNNTFGTAADITSQINSTSLTALVSNLNIATTSDLDYFTFTAPVGTASTFTVNVQSNGLSLMCPSLTVYAADQTTVLGSVTGLNRTGNTLSLTISNVQAGQRFYVKVAGADTTAFGTGIYALALNFGKGASPTASSPNTQTLATGTPTTGGGQANDTLLPNNIVTQTTIGVVNVVGNLALVPGPGTAPMSSSDLGSATGTGTSKGKDALHPADTNHLGIAISVLAPTGTDTRSNSANASIAWAGNATVTPAGVPLSAVPGPRLNTIQSSAFDQNRETTPELGNGPNLIPAADDEVEAIGPPAEGQSSEKIIPTAGTASASSASMLIDPWSAPSFLQWLTEQPEPHSTQSAGSGWGMERPMAFSDDSPGMLAAGMAAFLGLRGGDSGGFDGRWRRHSRPKPVDNERRRATRYPCWLNSYCWPLGKPAIERCQSMAEDVSATGANLVLHRPFDEGTVLIMELEGAAAGHERRVVARVVRVEEEAPGVWRLGCIFDHAFKNEAVHDLLLGGLE